MWKDITPFNIHFVMKSFQQLPLSSHSSVQDFDHFDDRTVPRIELLLLNESSFYEQTILDSCVGQVRSLLFGW